MGWAKSADKVFLAAVGPCWAIVFDLIVLAIWRLMVAGYRDTKEAPDCQLTYAVAEGC